MKMYQVSTLQALMLGYSRAVIPVSELLSHGNIGLGTFTDVDGDMIVLDGSCYRAMHCTAHPVLPYNSLQYPLLFDFPAWDHFGAVRKGQ